jgi:hypothetical protein
MFGPRKIIVCGFSADDQEAFREMTAAIGLADLPMVFASEGQAAATLGEIVDLPDGQGYGQASALERAVVLSGLTEKELHAVMAGYRSLGQPGPLWATITENSIGWPLSALLKELAAERAAFLKRQSR